MASSTPEDLSCNDLKTTDHRMLDSLLADLHNNLDEGKIIPNENCFKVLSTIAAKSQFEPEWEMNSYSAKKILKRHFYTHPSEEESKGLSGSDEKRKVPDYLPAEITAPFPGLPGLASLVSGYYSNCALLTVDGRRCGLGSNGGFQYRYPGATAPVYTDEKSAATPITEESYCAQECATDLCPQWLGGLLTRAPTKAVIKYPDPTKKNRIIETLEIKIASVYLGIWGSSWSVTFENGLPINLNPGSIAAGCRLLNPHRTASAKELTVIIYLDPSDPEYVAHFPSYPGEIGPIRITFPEFPGGYFADSDSWRYSYSGSRLIASLTIPSFKAYEKSRDEQLALRQMERQIALLRLQSEYLVQPSIPSSLLSSSSSSSLPTLGKRTFTDYNEMSKVSGANQINGTSEGELELVDDDEDSHSYPSKTGRF